MVYFRELISRKDTGSDEDLKYYSRLQIPLTMPGNKHGYLRGLINRTARISDEDLKYYSRLQIQLTMSINNHGILERVYQ